MRAAFVLRKTGFEPACHERHRALEQHPANRRIARRAGCQSGPVSDRVTDGVWNSPLSGGRATGIPPYAGKYTLVILGLVGDAHFSAGDGYATLAVTADRSATMSATLADGSQFMPSAMVTDDGNWAGVCVAVFRQGCGGELDELRQPDQQRCDRHVGVNQTVGLEHGELSGRVRE